MRGLDETINQSTIVQKVLISLPAKFNPKVSTIEEMHNLETSTMDQLLRILTDYEMRTTKGKSTSREVAFKAYWKTTNDQECSIFGSDEEDAKFARRLKKGTGKYNGKLCLKLFNCGRVYHYA